MARPVRTLGRSFSQRLSSSVPLSASFQDVHFDQTTFSPKEPSSRTSVLSQPDLAFRKFSTKDLFKSYLVLKTCGIGSIVNNAETLLNLSNAILGKKITKSLVKHTFFNHFCGGETENEVKKLAESLLMQRVVPILDYGVEGSPPSECAEKLSKEDIFQTTNVKNVKSQIDLALKCGLPTQCAAKMSSLCNPSLLKKLSFEGNERMDENFVKNTWQTIEKSFPEEVSLLKEEKKDFIESFWKKLGKSELAPETFPLLSNLFEIGEEASSKDVSVMIDAEYFKFQTAIDELTLHLMEHFNKKQTIFINTIQTYLKNADKKTASFIESSKNKDFHLGIKLVRGAYMNFESDEAAKEGRESPIHSSLEDTANSYNLCAHLLLQNMKEDPVSAVTFATHNQAAIEQISQQIRDLRVPTSNIQFAQLLGMADYLTFGLASNGINVAKYVAFGPVGEVLPYLIRRGQENNAVLGSATQEKEMIKKEIIRRVLKL